MVSVCAACNDYYPWMAILIASIAGVVYILVSGKSLKLSYFVKINSSYFWQLYLLKFSLILVLDVMIRLRIDDPLDAVAVHGGPGLWGLMAASLLKINGGLLTSGISSLYKT